MKPSLTYVHFRVQWQILGPESPGQKFDREAFQKLFERLNQDRTFGGYDDFLYRGDRCELAKPRGSVAGGGQAFGKVAYGNDILTIVDEWSDASTNEFCQKIKMHLDAWFVCFPSTLAVVQTCWLRALATPVHYEDARQFLGDAVLSLGESFQQKFSAMPHTVGFTFACQRQQPSGPLDFESRISSWRDRRSVWIEVRGVAPLNPPVNAAKHDQAELVFDHCRRFLEDEVVRLLEAYDREGPSNKTKEA
jgi:hypothetical protein